MGNEISSGDSATPVVQQPQQTTTTSNAASAGTATAGNSSSVSSNGRATSGNGNTGSATGSNGNSSSAATASSVNAAGSSSEQISNALSSAIESVSNAIVSNSIEGYDENDERLVNANEEIFDEGFLNRFCKDFKRRKFVQFEPSFENMGNIFTYGPMSHKVIESLMQDISTMGDDRISNKFSMQLDRSLFLLQRIHQAIRREIIRDRNRTKASADALQSRIRSDAPPLSASARIGIKTAVRMFLILIRSANRYDQDVISDILALIEEILQEAPPLSLVDGPNFSPDIARGLSPLFDFVRTLITDKEQDVNVRQKAACVILGISISRGSLLELIVFVETLLRNDAGDREISLPVGKYLQYLLDYYPDREEGKGNDSTAMKLNSVDVDLDEDDQELLSLRQRRHSLARVGAEIFSGRRLSLSNDSPVPFQSSAFDKQRYQIMDDKEKYMFELSLFPHTAEEILKKNGYSVQNLKNTDLSSSSTALIIISQLDRLSHRYARQPEEDIWNDDPNRLAVIYKPLAMEVKPKAFIVFSSIIQTLSLGYFSSDGCPDSRYIHNMYMLVATLRILKSHLYQLVRAKLPKSEFDLNSEHISRIRSQIFKFLETKCAPRGGPLSSTVAIVSSCIQSEAAQILAEAFEFFYAAVSDQISYLGQLIRHFNSVNSVEGSSHLSLSQPEQDLLELLLSRFSSFNSGSLLMEELEQAKHNSQLPDLLCLVFSSLIEASQNEFSTALRNNASSLSCSTIMQVLSNFQKHLLSSAGSHIKYPENCVTNEAKRSFDEVRDVLLKVLLKYSQKLFQASCAIIDLAKDVIMKDQTSEELRRVGEDLLSESIVGKLARPLAAGLCFFAKPEFTAFCLKLYPCISEFLRSSDDLISFVKDIYHPEEEMAVDKKRIVQSRHPYRSRVDREEIVTIKNAKTLTITFDVDRCATSSDEDYVQIFKKPSKIEPLTPKISGAQGSDSWPKEPIIIDGDTIVIHFHSGSGHASWGFRITIVGTVLLRPLDWLDQFCKVSTWLCGEMLASLMKGSPLFKDEKEAVHKWLLLFRGGVESFSADYPNLSPAFQDLDCKFDILNDTQEEGCNSGELMLLREVMHYCDRGKQLIDAIESISPDRHILQPSIVSDARLAASALFAVLLKHSSKVKLLNSPLFSISALTKDDEIVRLWKKASDIKLEIRSLKAQGENIPLTLKRIQERAEFVLSMSPDRKFWSESVSSQTDIPSSPQLLDESDFNEPYSKRKRLEATQKGNNVTQLLTNTVKSLWRLKELMLIRSRLATTKKDPESVFIPICISFLLCDQNELLKIRSVIMEQRSRALMRLLGLKCFKQLISSLKNRSLIPELLKHLASVFRKPNKVNQDPEESLKHFLSNLETAGITLTSLISQNFFQLVEHLMNSDSLDDVSKLFLLDICNMDFEASDFGYLNSIGIVPFIDPLISFSATNRAVLSNPAEVEKLKKNGRLRRQPWHVKFCAWSLFRLIAYTAASHGIQSDLQESLFQMLFEQISVIWEMRSYELLKCDLESENGSNFMLVDSDSKSLSSWWCINCTFLNNDGASSCVICGVSYDDNEKLLQFEHEREESETKGMEFIYTSDFDNKGIMYYLGTNGYTESWINPHDRNVIKVTASSLQNDSEPAQAIVGLSTVRCVTAAKPNQSFKITFLEHTVCPSHYSLKHYSSWDTEALRSWKFEASNDGINWTCLREHINDAVLDKKGATHTWELPKSTVFYSQFRIFMTNVNSNDHWYLALSGFEVYGILDLQVESSNTSSSIAPTSIVDYFDTQDTVDIEFSGDDPPKPTSIIHTNTSESWHTAKGVVSYSSGKPLVEFRIDNDGGGTNTWKFIIGVVPVRFQINAVSTWIGSQGGWGYIGGLGHKNHNSSTNFPYSEPFSTGDIIGIQMDFEKSTIEFLKNGKSMGIAYENLAGPVNVAVSMTGPRSKVTLLQSESNEKEVRPTIAGTKSWSSRIKQAHLGESSIIWYKHHLDDAGYRGKSSYFGGNLSVGELDCFMNQFLWLIFRCLKSNAVQRILMDSSWVRLILSISKSASPVGKILSLRICRAVLPQISPREINSGFPILEEFFDRASLSCFEFPKISNSVASSISESEDFNQIITDEPITWKVVKGSMDVSSSKLHCRSGFSTALANIGVSEGKWYYEVHLITGGLLQIGWSHMGTISDKAGDGVGDDSFSWAYDGSRCKKWHAGSESYGDRKWQAGDVIGVCINLDERTISFSLSGSNLGVCFSDIEIKGDIYPAISLWTDEACECIFESSSFRYPIPPGYQALSFKIQKSEYMNEPSSWIQEDAIGSEYVALIRTLNRSALWRTLISEKVLSSIQNLPSIISKLNHFASCLESEIADSFTKEFEHDLIMLFSSLAILGGNIEAVREGARVRLISSDLQNSEGFAVSISKELMKSRSYVIQFDSGDQKSIQDLSRIVALPAVDASLNQFKDIPKILSILAKFLHECSTAQIAQSLPCKLIYYRLQRICLRVLLGFLQGDEYIKYFIENGFANLIAKKALLTTEPIATDFTNTVGNLEARVLAVDKRKSEIKYFSEDLSENEQILFSGPAVHAKYFGSNLSGSEFDDFKFLIERNHDNDHRMKSLRVWYDDTSIRGFQTCYILGETDESATYHLNGSSSDYLSSEANFDDDEYISSVSVCLGEEGIRCLVLRTNHEKEFNFGKLPVDLDALINFEAPSGRGISAFYGSLSGSLINLGAAHQEVFSKKLKRFTYVHDFDENGILYFIGTQLGTSSWKNPASLGLVEVSVAKTKSDSAPVSAVVGREAVRCLCHDMANGWFVIDLKRFKVRPTYYTLRHYITWDTEALRNWNLEGSNNGTDWILIKKHVNDTSLQKKGQAFTWELPSISEYYSKFRILMTGKNSNDHNYLSLSGFEIYGDMQIVSSKKKVTLSESHDHIRKENIVHSHTRNMVETGFVFSCGHGGSGRLGQGSIVDVGIPSRISGFDAKVVIEVSSFNQHALLLTEDGNVFSWGNGSDGRLGYPSNGVQNSPKCISSLENVKVVQVRAGNSFSLVLDSKGKVWSFGKGNEGQLGTGCTSEQKTPVMIQGSLENVEISRIGNGAFHVLALSSTGDLWVWGRNLRGQLGINSTEKKRIVPEKVLNAPCFISTCGGWDHSLGLTANGQVYSWGNGYEGTRPATGLGTLSNTLVPTHLDILKDKEIVRISCGWDHSMALCKSGKVYIWGSNSNGVLGDGTTSNRSSPISLEGALASEKIVWIDGGQNHTSCVTEKGELWQWGSILGVDQLTPKKSADPSSPVIFRYAICGDKATFCLSTDSLPKVPTSPINAIGAMDSVVPPYPRSAYLLGHPSDFFEGFSVVSKEKPKTLSVQDPLLPMNIVSCDGGEYNSAYPVSNLLNNDDTVYCTVVAKNVNILFEAKDGSSLLFLRSIKMRNPDSANYTAPLSHALIFALDNASEVELTKQFDGYDSDMYKSFLNQKKKNKTQNQALEPIAFLDLTIENERIANVDSLRPARYVLVKLISSRQSQQNIDLEYIGFFGYLNSLPDVSVADCQETFDEMKVQENLSRAKQVLRNYVSSSFGVFRGSIEADIENNALVCSPDSSILVPIEVDSNFSPRGASFSFAMKIYDVVSSNHSIAKVFDEIENELISISCSADLCSIQLSLSNGSMNKISRDYSTKGNLLSNWACISVILDANPDSSYLHIHLNGEIISTTELDKELVSLVVKNGSKLMLSCGLKCAVKNIAFWPYCISAENVLNAYQSSFEFILNDIREEKEYESNFKSYDFSNDTLPKEIEPVSDLCFYSFSKCSPFGKQQNCLKIQSGDGLDVARCIVTSVSYSIVMDILISKLTLSSKLDLLKNQGMIESILSVDCDGHIIVFGQACKKSKPIMFDKWIRLIFSVDLSKNQIYIYCDGNILASSNDKDFPLNVRPYSISSKMQMFISQDHLANIEISSLQIRTELISQANAIKYGTVSNCLDSGRDLHAVSQSLLQMGFNFDWCKKALIQNSMKQYMAFEWIMKNRSRLLAEDKLEEHRRVAETLSLIGVPKEACSEALGRNGNDLRRAIESILLNYDSLEFNSNASEFELSKGTAVNLYVEKGAPKNAAFKILKSTKESMDQILGSIVQRTPPKRVVDFPEIKDMSYSELASAQIHTEEALIVAYCRSCIMAIFNNWPSDLTPSLSLFGNSKMVVKFVRLVEFSQLRGGLEILSSFLNKILYTEESKLQRLSEQISIKSLNNAPVAKELYLEVLEQMVGIFAEPTCKISTEDEAIRKPSHSLILWILNLFGELYNPEGVYPKQCIIRDLFFSKPVINLIFEVIAVSSGEQRSSFVRILTRLIKMGLKFDSGRSQVLKDLMNHMHVAQSPNGVYSSFFQALVELNVAVDRLQRSESIDVEMECKEEKEMKSDDVFKMDIDTADESLGKSHGIQFIYSEDFDTNGIMYYLGTNQNISSWNNPAELGVVKVTSSSLMNDSAPVSAVVGRDAVRCVSQPIVNQWFMIDLLEHSVIPTHYTLRHYISWDTEALRNWKFEGSNDGVTWVTLKEHVNDSSLNKKGDTHTWELYDIDEAYSKFRLFMTGLNSNQHWYMAISGFELYGTLDAETLSWEEEEVELQFDHDGDENGICYYLGSKRKTQDWKNPAEQGFMDIVTSSLQHNSEPSSTAVGRNVVRCVSQPNPHQWFMFDFKDVRIVPSKYSIRHYSSYDTEALRNWNFEASNDGTNWVCLSNHKNDASLTTKGQWASWDISAASESYSKFRVYMTNKNSNDHWYLAISGFELYGKMILRTGQKTKKTASISRNKPWFENVLLVYDIIRAVQSGSDLPEEFSKKIVKSIMNWPSEKEYLKSRNIAPEFPSRLQEFHAINATFTSSKDHQIVQLINRTAERLDQNPRSIKSQEWNPSAEDLLHYDQIENLPLRTLQIRFFVLQQLNLKIASVLPYIDFSLPNSHSVLSDGIKAIRNLIFWKTKEGLWQLALDSTNCSASDVELELDRFRAKKLKDKNKMDEKGRKSIFGQAFQQIYHRDPKMFRLEKGKCAWKTVFKGEFSDDFGGPYRNSIDDMCAELQSQVLPLFIRCPNGRENIGANREKYVPRPSSVGSLHIRMYEFVGKLLGLAMRTKNVLDLDLPSIIWKPLVGEQITEDDVLSIDLLSFKILDELKKFESNKLVSENLFEEYINSKFVAIGSDQKTYPLIPGGENIPVTWENRNLFVKSLIKFRTNEFQAQSDAIRRGLATVVPYPLLSLFTWQELELQVCGRPKMNLDLLERMTTYEGCTRSDPHIVLFWRMLKDRLDDEERCQFLRFVWGRSRLPVRAEDFDRKFKISRLHKSDLNPDNYLPISHTCFFSLDLPKYSTLEIMHQKVLYAITHCVAIDADDTSNAQEAARRNAAIDMDSDEDI